jgi:hypothetical protein
MLIVPLLAFTPGKTDFAAYYGPAYTDAVSFFAKNRLSFQKAANEYNIREKNLKSIVFPELLRYNILQNLIETKALELLYVKGGTKAADFSIGHFQMKPSFAEKVEAIAADNDDKNDKKNDEWAEDFHALCSYGNLDEKSIRAKRVERLSSLEWQLKYLACFYRYTERQLNKTLSPSEKIQKIAARYNCGLQRTEAEIEKLMKRPSFPYGYSVDPKIQHNYSDVAVYFFLM